MNVSDDESHTTEILGEERASKVVEYEPPHRLRTVTTMTGREGFGVKPGTREMTIVLEAADSGTRVVITNSGFGDGAEWDADLEAVTHGLGETVADLQLYLQTGVAFPRHHRGVHVDLGFSAKKIPAGVEVEAVQAGSFADKLGLEPGDVVVELDGAGVFGFAELQYFTKTHTPGDKAEAGWIRSGQLTRGSAELGARLPVASVGAA
jgi:hypothetical protein